MLQVGAQDYTSYVLIVEQPRHWLIIIIIIFNWSDKANVLWPGFFSEKVWKRSLPLPCIAALYAMIQTWYL